MSAYKGKELKEGDIVVFRIFVFMNFKVLYFYLILCFIFSCGKDSENYLFEEVMMNCLESKATIDSNNVIVWWNKLEEKLINEGLLRDRSGEAYLSMFKTLSDTSSTKYNEKMLGLKKVMNLTDTIGGKKIWCVPFNYGFGGEESNNFMKSDSRWKELQKKTFYTENSVWNPIAIISNITNNFTIDDFNQPYIRLTTVYRIHFIYWLNFWKLDPFHIENLDEGERGQNALNIYLNNEGKIFIEGKLSSLRELKKNLSVFSIKPMRFTSYIPSWSRSTVSKEGILCYKTR